jgi:hypothetical protein
MKKKIFNATIVNQIWVTTNYYSNFDVFIMYHNNMNLGIQYSLQNTYYGYSVIQLYFRYKVLSIILFNKIIQNR